MHPAHGSVAVVPGVDRDREPFSAASPHRRGRSAVLGVPTRKLRPTGEYATGDHVADRDQARRAGAERQGLAGALHDDIGPLLFAIAARVQRAQVLHQDDIHELRRTVDTVAEHVLAASDRMRELLGASVPDDPADAVPVAVQRDVDDVARRGGPSGHLVVRGHARRLPVAIERVVLNCVRQALFNIERHAHARSVVVTLDYAPDELTVLVQDDGLGVPPDLDLPAVPRGNRNWGFTSMARQVEQQGGQVEIGPSEDGGTRVRLWLPT